MLEIINIIMPFSWFFIGFLIYSFNFYNLGNTIYRINETGNYSFSLIPLLTVGIFSPIKTLFMLIYLNEFDIFIHYLLFELTNFANLFTVWSYLQILYLIYLKFI
jgi:hypothetical protein